MVTNPLWRKGGRPGFYAEAGARLGDELELETGHDTTSTTVVLTRRDVAALAAVLYAWLRESPPGRGGVIVDPREAAALERELEKAHQLVCERDGCGHPMSFHGIGTRPGRPTPCWDCRCPAFR